MSAIKRFFCWFGWHSYPVGYNWDIPNGYRLAVAGGGKAQCRWCGGVGLVDSQGNLFNVEEYGNETLKTHQ